MSFFPIDASVEPTPPAELRSDTPSVVRESILTDVDNILADWGQDPLSHRTTVRALNFLLQEESFKRYPPCPGIHIFRIPDGQLHAVFAIDLKDALGWHVVVYDPNDYAGVHHSYTPPFNSVVRGHEEFSADRIHPLMRRQEGFNYGPLVGPGVCYALSYAFCRLYHAFNTDRSKFEAIITNDGYNVRDILRIVFGSPNNWVPILKGERAPPSLEQLRHYFHTSPKRKRE